MHAILKANASFHRSLLSLLLIAAVKIQAADGSWLSGRTGIQSWSDALNWTGGIIPGATTGILNTDTATFGTNTGTVQVTIDAGRVIRSLTFNGTNAAGLYTLGDATANTGEALHLASGGTLTQALGAVTTLTINAPLILEPASSTTAGSYTLSNNSTNSPNGASDTNLYKVFVQGDITGGTTTSTITLNLGGTAGIRGVNASANVISGLISNGGAAGGLLLNVSGADGGNRGAWSLTNNSNSFTGTVTVGGGTLIVSSMTDAGVNSALGAGSSLILNSGSHFKYNGSAASTNRAITNNGGIFYNTGSGMLTLNGAITNNGLLTFRGSSNITVNGLISGAGGISRTDGTTVFLTNTNTFLGNVSMSDGAFSVATITNAGINSPLGAGSTITFGQNSTTVGRLEFTGASGGSSNRTFILNNSAATGTGFGRIDNTITGQTLTLSGAVRSSNSNATFAASLALNGNGDGILSGVIGGTNAATTTPTNLTLSKTGAGTWALSNANIYYGATTISAGTLLALNSTGSATGTGNVATSGSGTLGGTGFITAAAGGSIAIASGTTLRVGTTHNASAGTAGPVGTTSGASQLSLGTAANVALTLAGTLQFDLFSGSNGLTAGTADKLLLNTTATSLTLGGTISVADVSGLHAPWRTGTWQLIDWTGATSATPSGSFTYSLPTASLASGYSFVTTDFLSTGSISIQKTAANHTWTGTTNASWNTTTNWEAGSVPSGSTDVFFGNATANLTHNIDGDKSVRNLYFTGEQNHVINTGSGGVLYAQGSFLQVDGGSQRFGTVQLRPRGTTDRFDIINEGTLRFDTAILFHRLTATPLLNFVFSGSGDTFVKHIERRASDYDASITINGPGTVTFTGFTTTQATTASGSMTGTTTINGGKLRLNNELNLGTAPAAFNAAHLTINGGTLAAYDTMTISDANRGITIGSNGGSIEVEPTKELTLASAITGGGTLNKTGSGTLILAGTTTHTGTLNVQSGVLQVAGSGFTGTGALTVANGAHLVGTGVVQASSLTLQSGATLQAGNLTTGTTTGLGTLTFTPLSSGAFDLQAGSDVLLSLTSATNQSALSPAFGGAIIGSPEYNAYVDAITGSGLHDQLVFNGVAGSTLIFASNLTVVGTSFSPVYGQIFNLLDWASVMTTNFSGFVVGSNRNGSSDDTSQFNLPDISGSGLLWDVSRFTTSGNVAIIPEPSRVLLLLLGFLFALSRRSRR